MLRWHSGALAEAAAKGRGSKVKDKIFYGWVIVGVAFMVATILLGIRFSFGVFFKPLESEFALSRATTSSIYSVYSVFCAIFALLGGWAVDRFGPKRVIFLMGLAAGLGLLLLSRASSLWQVFISYSLLLSVGTGGPMIVLLTTVSRWFEKKRGLALGITASGAASGTVVVTPLAAYLIATFSWRMSALVMGLVAWLVVMSLALLLRRDPSEIGAVVDGVKAEATPVRGSRGDLPADLSLLRALRTRSFWSMFAIFLFYGAGLNLILAHVVPYAIDRGVSGVEAATILSLGGILSIPFRVVAGRVADTLGEKIPGAICGLLLAGALVWLIRADDLGMFYLFAIAFGISWGGLSLVISTMVVGIFGGRSLGTIFGATDTGFALGAAIGPAIGGLLFDVTGVYTIAWLVGAAIMLIIVGLILLTRWPVPR